MHSFLDYIYGGLQVMVLQEKSSKMPCQCSSLLHVWQERRTWVGHRILFQSYRKKSLAQYFGGRARIYERATEPKQNRRKIGAGAKIDERCETELEERCFSITDIFPYSLFLFYNLIDRSAGMVRYHCKRCLDQLHNRHRFYRLKWKSAGLQISSLYGNWKSWFFCNDNNINNRNSSSSNNNNNNNNNINDYS